jgi:hypothetical protein
MSGDIAPSLLAVGWLGHGRRPVILSVVFGLVAIGNAAIQPTAETDRLREGLVLLLAKNELELSSPAIIRWNTFSRIMASQSFVDVFLIAPLEIIENLVKFNWSKLAGGMLSVNKRKVELLEAEIKAAGRECAYVFDARKRFCKKS